MGLSFLEQRKLSWGQLNVNKRTNAVDLNGSFAQYKDIVLVHSHFEKRFGSGESYIVFLNGLELTVHEES